MSIAVAKKEKISPPTIRERINSDGFKQAIAEILPKHVTPDRMARTALTALTRTPDLAKCDQASFFRCMMDLSQWGLEPDGRRAHLIPFRNRRANITECQLIIDYKGLVELAYRSGVVSKIHADVVHAGDLFVYNLGEVQQHIPFFLRTDSEKPEAQGEVIAAYCIVALKDGASKTEILPRDEVESIRNRSRAGNNGPWKTDWNEMAKKTAFRRVSKWIPLSADVRDAMERDDDRLQLNEIPAARTKTADEFAELLQRNDTPVIEEAESSSVDATAGELVSQYMDEIAKLETSKERDELIVMIESDDRVPLDAREDLIENARTSLVK